MRVPAGAVGERAQRRQRAANGVAAVRRQRGVRGRGVDRRAVGVQLLEADAVARQRPALAGRAMPGVLGRDLEVHDRVRAERLAHALGPERAAAEREHRRPAGPPAAAAPSPPRARGRRPRPRGRRTPRSSRPARARARGRRRRGSTPSSAATARAALVLPAPMKPTNTSARSPAATPGWLPSASTRCAPRRPAGPRARRRCGRRRTSRGRRHASTSATIASPTTAPAGTVQESVRSRSACAGSLVSVSTVRSGLVSVGIGFIAPLTHDRVAVRHAALDAAGAVGLAVVAALLGPEDLVVRLRADAARRASKPSPISTPFIAWIDMIAPRQAAVQALLPGDVRADARHERRRRAPRRRRRATRWPCARTLISSTIAALASASRQRTGDSSTPSKSATVRLSRSGAATEPICADVAADLDAEGAQQRLGQAAGSHPRGRLARAGALEHVAHVGEAVLLHARRGRRGRGAAGAPRRPRPRPATGSSAPPSWRSRGCRSAARPGCRACGRGARRR